MGFNKPKISAVIPTKNEEKTIGNIVKGVKKIVDEVLVMDGYSMDATREIAAGAGARVELVTQKGKGVAIRQAINKVEGDIIVFIDGDGSHVIEDIPMLIKPILDGEADHVSASRTRGGSDELHGDIEKFVKMVGSDIITLAINYRFNVRLTDSQNGFRAIKTEIIRKLNLQENITTIEQEMIIKTLKKGYIIVEIPSHEYERKFGSSKIELKKVWHRYIYSFLKYLFF